MRPAHRHFSESETERRPTGRHRTVDEHQELACTALGFHSLTEARRRALVYAARGTHCDLGSNALAGFRSTAVAAICLMWRAPALANVTAITRGLPRPGSGS